MSFIFRPFTKVLSIVGIISAKGGENIPLKKSSSESDVVNDGNVKSKVKVVRKKRMVHSKKELKRRAEEKEEQSTGRITTRSKSQGAIRTQKAKKDITSIPGVGNALKAKFKVLKINSLRMLKNKKKTLTKNQFSKLMKEVGANKHQIENINEFFAGKA